MGWLRLGGKARMKMVLVRIRSGNSSWVETGSGVRRGPDQRVRLEVELGMGMGIEPTPLPEGSDCQRQTVVDFLTQVKRLQRDRHTIVQSCR